MHQGQRVVSGIPPGEGTVRGGLYQDGGTKRPSAIVIHNGVRSLHVHRVHRVHVMMGGPLHFMFHGWCVSVSCCTILGVMARSVTEFRKSSALQGGPLANPLHAALRSYYMRKPSALNDLARSVAEFAMVMQPQALRLVSDALGGKDYMEAMERITAIRDRATVEDTIRVLQGVLEAKDSSSRLIDGARGALRSAEGHGAELQRIAADARNRLRNLPPVDGDALGEALLDE